MASIFTRIINREIPGFIVAEDHHHIAFLDVNPVAKGHVLVVPKKEVDYIFDLEQTEYEALWSFASRVAKGLKLAIPCEKIGVSVIGLEVPHAHIHLVPLQILADINFSKPKLVMERAELLALCELIQAHLRD